MPSLDIYPRDLTLTFHNNKNSLTTIPEDKEIIIPMSFPKMNDTMSWADMMDMEDSLTNEFPLINIFQPFDRLNFQPTVANFLAIGEGEGEEIDEDFLDEDPFDYTDNNDEDSDYDPNVSEFLNPMGQRVYFNQDEEDFGQQQYNQEGEEICCKCHEIQGDNILIQISKDNYYFCTECFYQEKQECNRKNADYQVQLRQKVKNPQKYQFICPGSGKPEKLNFKVHIPYNNSDEVLIIQAYKEF